MLQHSKNASRADCTLLVCMIQVLLPWSKRGAASVLQNYVSYLFTTHKIHRSRAKVKECIYILTQNSVIKNCHNNSPDTRTSWGLYFLSSSVNCGWENTCSRLLNSGVPPPLFHNYKNISLKHLCDYTHHFKSYERNHSTNKCKQKQVSAEVKPTRK
jgi:hypothetical protein